MLQNVPLAFSVNPSCRNRPRPEDTQALRAFSCCRRADPVCVCSFLCQASSGLVDVQGPRLAALRVIESVSFPVGMAALRVTRCCPKHFRLWLSLRPYVVRSLARKHAFGGLVEGDSDSERMTCHKSIGAAVTAMTRNEARKTLR